MPTRKPAQPKDSAPAAKAKPATKDAEAKPASRTKASAETSAKAPAKASAKAPAKASVKAEPKPKAKAKAAPAAEPAAERAAAAPEPIAKAEPEPQAAGRGRRKAATPEPAAPSPAEPATKAPIRGKAKAGDAQAPVLDPHAQTVLQALQDGCALEFIFHDGDANPPRTFEARQLCYDTLSKGWYAWGWDRRYNAERHHRLDLLKEINPVEGIGRAAQGPYKEGTAPNLLGGWLGGEPIPVKAVLMKQWIFAVRQAPPPFPEFRIEDIEDGKAAVSFTATDLRAIARWCMQFGDGIQVQEPQRLVDRIKQVGITWGGKPKAEAEPPRPAPPPPPPPRPQPAPPRREAEEKPKGKGPRIEVRTERL